MEDLADLFAKQKYVVQRSSIQDPRLSLLYRYVCRRAESGTMMHDRQVPEAWAAHGDIFTDGLLTEFLPIAQAISQLTLFPTYSYFRLYEQGQALEKHTDRPACEISLTLCLGYQAAAPWPIWIEGPAGVASVELNPGDALFYRGVECPHWREPLEGDRVAQMFLHYVDQAGPYSEWRYDKREHLSVPSPKFSS